MTDEEKHQFTINVYDLKGKMTHTFHPLTAFEPVHITGWRSAEFMEPMT
jgi:hypothetical protein